MAQKNWSVYVLCNRESDPRYVGVGKTRKGIEPWESVWLDRFKADDTQFTRWLRECNSQPLHRVVASGIAEGVANGIAAAERQRLKEAGEELLSQRQILEGHGCPRAVVDPNGDLFIS